MKSISYFYMIIAALFLGTIGVLVKLIGNNIPLMTLNFLRLFIGFITLLIIVPFFDKKWFKITKKDIKDFFFIGLMYAIALSCYNTANLFAPIQNVVLINYFHPFFILIFAFFILKEKITLHKIIALITAFIGLTIINPFQFGNHLFGNMLSLIGGIFLALLIVEMRKEGKNHNISDIIWFLFFGALILSPFPVINGFGNISKVWFYVLLLGVVSTGLAYMFYNLALKNIEAEISSLIAIVITPLTSITLAILVIGEQLNLRTIIGGGLLIIAGIYLTLHQWKIKS